MIEYTSTLVAKESQHSLQKSLNTRCKRVRLKCKEEFEITISKTETSVLQ